MAMAHHLRPALVMIVAFTLLTGIVYPLAVTGIAQVMFPAAANGSLVVKDGKVVGSALIGQAFESDRYFHPRPSATTDTDPNDPSRTIDAPYNAASSAGSNLGPITRKLLDRVKGDVEDLRRAGVDGPIPADAVTASASGLDPDVSPQTALLQAPRVAKARGLPEERVRALVTAHTEGRALGLLGEPRVNVLQLNLALDAASQ
jgi:potassium-transporting ATPase KdpC subunit